MRASLGARSDAQLSELLGYSRANVNLWRKRGAVPQAAIAKVQALSGTVQQSRLMSQVREQLGPQVLYEGTCLALYLAPSADAFGRRFGPTNYAAKLREYASLLLEIETACAEKVAERGAIIVGNAADAFESLTKDDAEALTASILTRARWWRYGGDVVDLDDGKTGAPPLHEQMPGFKGRGE